MILVRVQKASELHHMVTEDRIREALTLTAPKGQTLVFYRWMKNHHQAALSLRWMVGGLLIK